MAHAGRMRREWKGVFILCRGLRIGTGFARYFQYSGRAPAGFGRRMTRGDLHGRKVTLTAGRRMKRGARRDMKEQKGGRSRQTTARACPWLLAKAKSGSDKLICL